MKSVTISTKDNNYSLQNGENYKNETLFDADEAIQKYSELIIEYFKFVMENIKIKNSNFSKFIIIRGLDTITNVFLNILYFTKNVDLTYFHSQKSYYFYVEFVSQISDDEKMFLQLTSRDATTYVYKKTVFEITNELKKINENITNDFKAKLDIIKSYINLYQAYMLKIIHLKIKDGSYLVYVISLAKLSEKLNNLTNKSKIFTLEKITENLYNKIENIDDFFQVNHLLVKKFLKNQECLKNAEKKMDAEEFDDKLADAKDKFVTWFTN
jgi:hypothetical protein